MERVCARVLSNSGSSAGVPGLDSKIGVPAAQAVALDVFMVRIAFSTYISAHTVFGLRSPSKSSARAPWTYPRSPGERDAGSELRSKRRLPLPSTLFFGSGTSLLPPPLIPSTFLSAKGPAAVCIPLVSSRTGAVFVSPSWDMVPSTLGDSVYECPEDCQDLRMVAMGQDRPAELHGRATAECREICLFCWSFSSDFSFHVIAVVVRAAASTVGGGADAVDSRMQWIRGCSGEDFIDGEGHTSFHGDLRGFQVRIVLCGLSSLNSGEQEIISRGGVWIRKKVAAL
ncbi:hypothetical protein FGB62_293g06 [Gracilaria domingensis]|nr:hypothetical protein FGB62_293g06 [Gracilaria domingensis]